MKAPSVKALIPLMLLAAAATAAAQQRPPNDPGLQQRTTTTRAAETTLTWGQPPPPPAQARPAFTTLDRNGDGSVDEGEAAAYTVLANDFIYADGNRDGRISRREFDRW